MDKQKLESYLRNIEEITDLTGSFIISYPDGEVLAKTLMANLKEDVINEIFGVEATFQNFADFLEIGNLRNYILEGPNGIIIILRIDKGDSDQKIYFLSIGGKELHLPLIKIALIDFQKKVKDLM
ncbi:MAG: hypothetical protein ACTSRG_01855 [Candidatus Helarchaeota archaeon]